MRRFWLVLFLAAPLRAEYPFFPPVESTTTVESAAPAPDPFAVEAARRFDAPAEKVLKLRRRGFGKTELLSFLAIAKASKKTWDDLVQERDKGASLRRMAEEAGLDYNALFDRSTALKGEIEEKIGPGGHQ